MQAVASLVVGQKVEGKKNNESTSLHITTQHPKFAALAWSRRPIGRQIGEMDGQIFLLIPEGSSQDEIKCKYELPESSDCLSQKGGWGVEVVPEPEGRKGVF